MPPPGVPPLPPDLRNSITPDAFRIDPGLLGTPLARPWRRASAMGVDGLLIAILANAPGVLFGLAAALVLFRASARPAEQSYLRKSIRLTLRFWGAVVLFAVVISLWGTANDMRRSAFSRDEPGRASADEPALPPPPAQTGAAGVAVATDALGLTRAADEAEARERVERLVTVLQEMGTPPEETREMLEGFRSAPGRPWVASVADSALRSLEAPASVAADSPDSLAAALTAALAADDSAGAARLRERLTIALAADTIRDLSRVAARARERREAAEVELREAREGSGILRQLRSIADDLGLGFGWSGLYFTACLALWDGYTPGKRLLRVRVIRLDGKPMGWWMAFERFGGYAASLATGLLGFAQILWDRNRQGIHDKIAETVVVKR